jgi:mRNA-degrading endonuclease RelE of RelBE toxin-antitoxin system
MQERRDATLARLGLDISAVSANVCPVYSHDFSRAATKDMARLPADARKTIQGKIAQLARDPWKMAGVKKIVRDESLYCLRVRGWRVVYEVEGQVITILKVEARGGAYK